MAFIHIGNNNYIGNSTDTLPTNAAAGAICIQKDTPGILVYDGVKWKAQTPVPTSGRLFGVRQGFNNQMINSTAGYGTLSVVSGNGTGAAVALSQDTTDGPRANATTGTNNTFARAGYWGNCGTARKYNPTFTVRFRLGQAQTSSQGMLYIGFANQSAQPAAGTSMLATYLDAKIGALFGFRPADTTWMFISNNAQTNATYTSLTGLPNSGATDTSAHTISITLDDITPAIRWSFDGVVQTAITDTTNNVPPTATLVYPVFILEAQTVTGLQLIERWSQYSMDTS
jgi:hypothetical protein